MGKWTPGPWKIDDTHVKTAINAGNTHVAMVNWGVNRDEHEANTYLIAAAPDLYEALRNIENDDGSIPATIWKMAQDAIAKAEGRDKE